MSLSKQTHQQRSTGVIKSPIDTIRVHRSTYSGFVWVFFTWKYGSFTWHTSDLPWPPCVSRPVYCIGACSLACHDEPQLCERGGGRQASGEPVCHHGGDQDPVRGHRWQEPPWHWGLVQGQGEENETLLKSFTNAKVIFFLTREFENNQRCKASYWWIFSVCTP